MAKVHRMERGENVSAEWCLFLCDGPTMNWPLVRSVSATSPQTAGTRPKHDHQCKMDGWMNELC